MKKITLFVTGIFTCFLASAQSDNTNQNLSFTTGDNIAISFVSTGDNTGAQVTLPFATIADFMNGVTSPEQQLEVSSNLNFFVDVKANATNFTYSGPYTANTTMPVDGVLKLMITSNNTGGNISSPFSSAGYTSITSNNQTMLNNCVVGTNQAFAIKYQGTPGLNYPGGTYTVNVIYTATQL